MAYLIDLRLAFHSTNEWQSAFIEFLGIKL